MLSRRFLRLSCEPPVWSLDAIIVCVRTVIIHLSFLFFSPLTRPLYRGDLAFTISYSVIHACLTTSLHPLRVRKGFFPDSHSPNTTPASAPALSQLYVS